MKVKDMHPPAHRKYVLLRNGIFYTATPCYGMHGPLWVVRILFPEYSPEADPQPMLPDDEWWHLDQFKAIANHPITRIIDANRDFTSLAEELVRALSKGTGREIDDRIRIEMAPLLKDAVETLEKWKT